MTSASDTDGTAAQPCDGESGKGWTGTGLGDWVGWGLVIAGWIYVRRDEAKRALRSEERETIHGISQQICAVRDGAARYYTRCAPGDGDALEAEAFLKQELKSISLAIGRLCERKPKHYTLNHFVAFRKAVTLGNFESNARTLLGPKDDQIQGIRLAAIEVIDNLTYSFERANPL